MTATLDPRQLRLEFKCAHRWQLPSFGLVLEGRCTYCGALKTFKPFEEAKQRYGRAPRPPKLTA